MERGGRCFAILVRGRSWSSFKMSAERFCIWFLAFRLARCPGGMALADYQETTASRSVSIRGGAVAIDPDQLRSPEQLIDDLSNFLAPPSGPAQGGSRRKENLPPHARAYTVDDDEFDEPMPIPSTWREASNEPEERGWFVEQTWAAVLGFAVGLVIVIPAILFATARFGALEDPAKVNAATGGAALVQLGGATGVAATSPLDDVLNRVGQPAPQSDAAAGEAPPAQKPLLQKRPAPAVRQPTTVAVASPVPANPGAEAEVPEIRVVARPTMRVPVAEPTVTTEKQPFTPQAVPVAAPAKPATLESKLPSLADARRRIALGEVLEGRKLLAQLASGGDTEAVFALAETYDPNILAAWALQGVKADVGKARLFYSMALSRGLKKARQRLIALD